MNTANTGFEAMARLSARMVAAAQANDWELLVQTEQQLSEIRVALQNKPGPAPDAAAAARRRTLIEQMQADQDRILEHVQPWMDSTRKMLSAQSKSRAVHKAYAAPGF